MSGLLELAERVEAATGPDRALDRAIMDAVFQPWRGFAGCRDAYTDEPVEDAGWIDGKGSRWIGAPSLTASLDAAMKLVPEGCNADLYIRQHRATALVDAASGGRQSYAATPALALCAAALRARATHSERMER